MRDILAMENQENFQQKRCCELLLYLALNIEDFQILPKIKLETDLPLNLPVNMLTRYS
ncbi:MAG: hypothetical protein F6K17_41645 [Okeania sp. SIO3C4]|nr:hypothetical protein [Okeania sp. SIO3C4]